MEGILEGVTTCHRLSHFVTIVTGCDTCSRLPSLTIVSSVINEASVVVNMYLRFIDNQATKQVNPTAQKKYLISPIRVAFYVHEISNKKSYHQTTSGDFISTANWKS